MSQLQEISLQELVKHLSQPGGARGKGGRPGGLCLGARGRYSQVDLTSEFAHLGFREWLGHSNVAVEGWKLIYPFVAIIIILLQPHCTPPPPIRNAYGHHSLATPSVYDVSNILPIRQF